MLTVYEYDDRIFNALCAGDRIAAEEDAPRAADRELARGRERRVTNLARSGTSGGFVVSHVRPRAGADYDLTAHETRLLRMLVDGHNYTTAAEELKVSVNTVRFI